MLVESLVKFEPSFILKEGSNDKTEIQTISHCDSAQDSSFIFLKKKKFLHQFLENSNIKKHSNLGLIFEEKFYNLLDKDLIINLKDHCEWIGTVENVDHAMSRLSKPFYDQKIASLNYHIDGRQMNKVEIHPDAEIAQNVFIGENCVIGANVTIMPGCVIMPEVIVEAGTIIFPNVTLYPFTHIGGDNRIHAGTVIGTDGFGYNFFEGKHHKVWHLAGVKTGREVEIGCNTMIDAGTFSPTRIGDGSKIDNDVQISHNVNIKEHVIICGTTGIAGSVVIENFCAFGAGAGVAPSAVIGQGAQVAARAVVSENTIVKAGEVVAGHPARPLRQWLRSQAVLNKLGKK